MAGLNKGVPPPTEIKLHQISDGHDTGIYSWDLTLTTARGRTRCGDTTLNACRKRAPVATRKAANSER